jgi:ABC-2 type transport system ATP-binding protein
MKVESGEKMSSIRVEGLVKTYGSLRALDGLDLKVEPGSIFGFLGPNGSGKTTTMRILTGLARPTSGQAWVAGVNLATDGLSLSRCIGYLPEEPAFYAWMTPLEFLDYLGRLYGFQTKIRSVRTKELLDLVKLSDSGRRRIGGFSRGMRQRLGIAAALVNQPEVLFLDEPASALDPAGRKEVLDLIEGLRGQCTVLMSTHILADVERVCDVIGILARGRLIVQSPRQDLLDRYAIPVFELETNQAEALQNWAAALKSQPWVASAEVTGHTARIVVKDVSLAKQNLLPGALQSGLVLSRFEELKPSLEDIFLRLVGGEGLK